MAKAKIGQEDAILAANGVGGIAAARGAGKLLASHRVSAVISVGFAGALDPSLKLGQVLFAREVIYSDRRYAAHLPGNRAADSRTGTLLTVDEIVRCSRAKRELSRHGAHAVDMEAAAVAAVAARDGLPFFCVRTISDLADQDIALDVLRARRRDDTISVWRVLAQALPRPAKWLDLFRLWRGGRAAARSLAKCLPACDFRIR